VPWGKICFEKTLTHYDIFIILQDHAFFNIFDKKTGAQQNIFLV